MMERRFDISCCAFGSAVTNFTVSAAKAWLVNQFTMPASGRYKLSVQ